MTMLVNVLCGRNASRSARSAAETAIPPARPTHGPPATAHASTAEQAQIPGIVGAPLLIRPAVSIKRVLSTRPTETAKSVTISHGWRPDGRANAATGIIVQPTMNASAIRPPAGGAKGLVLRRNRNATEP